MGRYYKDIDNENSVEGQFWFGIQSTTALDEIGIMEDTEYIYYYLYQEDKKILKEYMDKVREDFSTLPTDEEIIALDYENLYDYAKTLTHKKKSYIANYALALKCYEALKIHNTLRIQCET
jgi:hypothetical protein